MEYKTLEYDLSHQPVAVLTLSRPDAANALNRQMALELKDFFANLPAHCRVLVITGKGRHFCAGADLKERKGMDEGQWHQQHAAFKGALHAILDCPLPVIAAVNGAAFGGGLELALACDFIYAEYDARFGLTETKLGIMPGLGGTYQLGKRIGTARAKELVFSARAFSAEEAHMWGLVNHLSGNGMGVKDALETGQLIAANAPLSVRAVKQAVKECDGVSLEKALACELTHYNNLLKTKDRHEGINAFNEKRTPVFKGE
ncbi:MAG: enoyl-CoA hydratase/isomerase family protein [Alphaproteobacteria bacterium]